MAEHCADEPQWPNLRLDDIEAPRVNPRPAFVDPQEVEDRIMGRKRSAAQAARRIDSEPAPARRRRRTASTPMPASPRAGRACRPSKQPSPFVFEAGARYWYSSGSMKFGFTNGNPLFGNPTSTLDWHGLTGHSGEVFARLDHMPSGVFVKGMVGGGADHRRPHRRPGFPRRRSSSSPTPQATSATAT